LARRRSRRSGAHRAGAGKRRKSSKPSPFEKRAWHLAALRSNIKLEYRDDHVSMEAPGMAPIHVFAKHTTLTEPTKAEKARVRKADPSVPIRVDGLHLPAAHRLEQELVVRRLDAVPKRRVKASRPSSDRHERAVREGQERARRRELRHKAARGSLLAAAPLLRAAGVGVAADEDSIVIRDGSFSVEELRAEGAIELRSRYAPAMRFVGLETVFEEPDTVELAATLHPASRKGGAVHAPVGSDAWRTLVGLRAQRAVRAQRAAEAVRLREREAEQRKAAEEQRKRERARLRSRALGPEVAAQLAKELSDDTDACIFEDGRIYLNDVPAAELVLDPEPHLQLYEEPPLRISGTAVIPAALSPPERKQAHAAAETDRPAVLTRIVRERLRSSRRNVLAGIGEARKLLVELDADPVQTRDGLCVAGDLEVPFGVRVPLEQLKIRHCGRLLAGTVEKQLGSKVPGLAVARDGPGSVVASAGERPIAQVEALAAVVQAGYQRAVVKGRFLEPGGHWSALLDKIAALFPEIEIDRSRDVPAVWQVIRDVPDGIPPALVERCLDASHAIRTRRNAAFANPVKLSTAGKTKVTFFPIQDDGEPFVPITHERGDAKIRCRLRLAAATDPLPLVLRGAVDEPAGIWVLSLLGFATLTVIPELAHLPRSSPPRRRRAPSQRVASRPRSGRLPVRSARARQLSRDLEPTGITRTAHWVVGHVRLLAPGQVHSEEAEQEAGRQGIKLRPNETWVRPHVRGVSSSEPLTFRWQLPHEALSLVP
jgi:hypothetical protein